MNEDDINLSGWPDDFAERINREKRIEKLTTKEPMATKEYVSMFVTREVRQGLKTKAAQLDFRTLIDFLEAIKNTPIKNLTFLKK